jgi:hypothetical protein
MVVLVAAAAFLPACAGAYLHEPTCRSKDAKALILAAQAVPSATLLPCIAEFPSGWSYDGSGSEAARPSSSWTPTGPASGRSK